MVVPVSASMPDSNLTPTQVQRKFASSSLAGLGTTTTLPDGTVIDDSLIGGGGGNSSVDLCALYPSPGCPGIPYTWDSGGGGGGGGGVSVYPPSSGGPDWTSILNNLTRAGVDVSKLALIQPGTTLTAGGAISRQNPGYAIPGTNTASLGLNAGGGSTTLLLGLGLLVAFMMMNKK